VLSGCGGDELFGGYPWRYFYSDSIIPFDDFIDKYYTKWQRLIPNSKLQKLLSPIWDDVKHVNTRDIFANVFATIKTNTLTQNDCINYSLYLEAKTFLHGLLVVEDKLSMAYGLEVRVPLLDNDLVDFACKIPNYFKLVNYYIKANENDYISKVKANRNGKLLLRKTLSKYLDDKITNFEKQGFSSPDASWFRGESVDYVKKIVCDSLLFKFLLDKETLEELVNEHIDGKENRRLFLWSFLYIDKFKSKYCL
jgi:asparagine synthase (glutamine-hydrolysing)